MNRRTFAALAVVTPLVSGCLWDRYFEIEWDEEVKLHDGRVIVVHLKYKFERLYNIFREFTRYGGAIVPRDVTITFDAGGNVGQVVQLFKGYRPIFLGQHNGTWYATLAGGYYPGSRQTPGQDWGEIEGPSAHKPVRLVGKHFQHISIHGLPTEFQLPNMLWLNGRIEEHVAFNNTTITLEQKKDWLAKHPLGPGLQLIERPTAAVRTDKSSISINKEGANK